MSILHTWFIVHTCEYIAGLVYVACVTRCTGSLEVPTQDIVDMALESNVY